MNDNRFFVFIYPKRGEISSLLNLAIFALYPQEKWPAHITVAGPFRRRPKSRAQPEFERTVFSLSHGNFFQQGLSTVFLHIGMMDIRRYWDKPDFIGNPIPHLSLYNGRDRSFAEQLFAKLYDVRPTFAFDVEGIEVVNSSSQRRMDLRQSVDVNSLPATRGMSLDYLAQLPPPERLQIATAALERCKPASASSRIIS